MASADDQRSVSAGRDPLLRLAKEFGRHWGDFDTGIARITEAASEALDVDRASVWFFDEGHTLIRCADLFDRVAGRHEHGTELAAKEFPAYFEALDQQRVLAAVDARIDERTREFKDHYLDPLGIIAMLDAPLWHDGRNVGVLCNEDKKGPRAWTESDRSLAGSLADFLAMTLEANDRRIAEVTLRDREAELRAIVDNAYDVIASVNTEWELHYFSPRMGAILGRSVEDLSGRRWMSHLHPDDIPKVQEAIIGAVQRETPYSVTCRWERDDGEWRWFEARGRSYGEGSNRRVVVVARDVTERLETEQEALKLERQLVQAQKLEAVGRLAGGVAHDFNNILTAILGHADLALATPHLPEALREELAEIRRNSLRASELTHQLLTLSSSRDARPEVFDVHASIENLTRMIRRVIGEEIECVLERTGENLLAFAEPARFDQVLVNLAINARDAMPNGGRLTIATRRMRIGHGATGEVSGVDPGEYVRIDVSDTGTGIADEIVDHIFDPFFTTKGPGEGTGLGLAMVYGIMRRAGGSVHVSSVKGEGTRFTLLLPCARDGEATPEPRPVRNSKASTRGSERILIVEDEAAIRRLFRRIMTAEGYEVHLASNGADGIARLDESDTPFDLVISDVRMPQMNGHELARRLHELHPGTPILLISGYAVGPDGDTSLDEESLDILAKPFLPAELVSRVRQLLDRRS